jgi:hypothetical protein
MGLNLTPVKVSIDIETLSLERSAFYNLCFITENDVAPRTLEVNTLSDLLDNGYTRLDLAYNFCVGVLAQQGKLSQVSIRSKRTGESYEDAYKADDNNNYYYVVLQTKDIVEISRFNQFLLSSGDLKLQFYSNKNNQDIVASEVLVNYYQDYKKPFGGVNPEEKDFYLNIAYDGTSVVIDTTINSIGIQGASTFGVGVTETLPLGMSEMTGTRTVGHENYGNYRHTDGSIMCWIPMFYYRWGHADSPRTTKYGLNSLDVKSKYDFIDVAAANDAGYALHRAFYDDGQIKDGFFVDKYQASNNAGVASSIKNGIPLSSANTNAPFSALNGTPDNTYAGAIDAVKTRGEAFFVTTLFVQRALSLLSMAHAQAATSVDNCAWYDSTGVANYPKGNNNDAFSDINDTSVLYVGSGYLNSGKTGSALPFAKTTHNGQTNGVADLNGNMFEICLGVTQLSGTFYALKTTAKASSLTSGATAANDAWGASGIAANYESLGARIGALTGVTPKPFQIGNSAQQVFSSATTGKDWQASCAGIPLSTGVNSVGTDLFGRDFFYDTRVDDMCPSSGGFWRIGENSGIWTVTFGFSRLSVSESASVRGALYIQ